MGERKNKKTYVPRTNAVCVTIYNPHGEPIPAEVATACVDAIQSLIHEHRLLVGVATT